MMERLGRRVCRVSATSAVVAVGLAFGGNANGGAADEINASGQPGAAQAAATATAATPGTVAAAADSLAAKKAAAAQKALSMQKVSAALRSRRALAQRSSIAYDDVNGQGTSSLFSGASNWRSPFNQGSNSSGAGSAYSGTNGSTGTSGNLYTNSAGTGSSGTASTGSSGQSTATTLGLKIVQYAQSQLGQTVGDGSSKALVDAALSNAGAKPASQNAFGDVVALNTVQPGDILQFQSAIFLGMNYWMILGTPDHTAIVFMVQGSDVILLHQDVNGIRLVQYSTVNLNDLHSGTITAYRAVASDTSSTDAQSTTAQTSGSQTSGTPTSTTTGGQSSGNPNCSKVPTSGSQPVTTTTSATAAQQSGT